MSHADKADKLLIKPTAGARPASPCMPRRFIRKARDTRPDARRVTSSTDDTTLATAPDGPTKRLSQFPNATSVGSLHPRRSNAIGHVRQPCTANTSNARRLESLFNYKEASMAIL